jgi:hypothetical protein
MRICDWDSNRWPLFKATFEILGEITWKTLLRTILAFRALVKYRRAVVLLYRCCFAVAPRALCAKAASASRLDVPRRRRCRRPSHGLVQNLVDSAANTVRDAERNSAGLAISHDRKDDPLRPCDPRLKPCGRQVSRLPYRTPGSRLRLLLLAS